MFLGSFLPALLICNLSSLNACTIIMYKNTYLGILILVDFQMSICLYFCPPFHFKINLEHVMQIPNFLLAIVFEVINGLPQVAFLNILCCESSERTNHTHKGYYFLSLIIFYPRHLF